MLNSSQISRVGLRLGRNFFMGEIAHEWFAAEREPRLGEGDEPKELHGRKGRGI